MFYYISSIAIILFEVICCIIFFESFCNKDKDDKKYSKICLITGLVMADFACALFLSQWLIVKLAVITLITAISMKWYFKISIGRAIVFSFLFVGLLMLVDYIAYSINNTIFLTPDMPAQESELAGSMVIVLAKIILFLCVIIIKKYFGKKKAELLVDSEWIRFLFFPVFTIVMIAAITMTFKYVESSTQAMVLYLMAFGMVGMNIFVYYLINNIMEREMELHEKKIFEIQVKNQLEMYNSISDNFERQKQKSHEFKNHILCIEGLLKEKQYAKLESYVYDISSVLSNEKNAINTNNAIVNAILNTKYQEAISKQIVFVCKVNDLSEINLNDEDIVVLLANLLNNAIEACESCVENRVLKLKFVKEEENIVLSVKNTYSKPLIYKNNEIVTSKILAPEEHGVGIKNIIRVVEKYNGSYVIQHDNIEFFFSILIPIIK